jgi:D-alanyl-D-alanine carboxypeptidase
LAAVGLAALIALSLFSTDADARNRRKHRPKPSYNPPYASLVVEVNSGKVLESTNPDAERHPASLTKMMTLYLLFERLEAGKMKLSTEMNVSAHAAAQAPSKLGLKPGQSIDVETAIKALVTKSANDVAVIVAESLGGSEPAFGRLMTAKARALGMNHTTYVNASGLPDDRQITTARDQAILGRALQDRFPKYYPYFGTRVFTYRGKSMRNHNHLLGKVEGVDGIKTGYIRASGFNIVTSARRGSRHIVAVVIGGASGKWRDARVRSLINSEFKTASTTRTAPLVVEGWQGQVRLAGPPPTPSKDPRDQIAAKSAPVEPPAKNETAELAAKVEATQTVKIDDIKTVEKPAKVAAAAAEAPSVGSTAPIKPVAIRTVSVQPSKFHVASLSPLPSNSRKLDPAPAGARSGNVTTVATIKRTETPVEVASAAANVPLPAAAPEPAAKARSGWMIQVGAFDDEKEAKHRLHAAQTKANDQLAKAELFTERVAKGEKSLYRARFAGLEKAQAEAACKHLKRSEIPCLLLKN